MKMYFCYFKSNCLPTDICTMIDLGECKSVKAACLRVTRAISEDPFFSPKSYEVDGGSCGSICDVSGKVLARLVWTDHGYKFKAA